MYAYIFFLSFPYKHIRASIKKIEALSTEISEMEQQVREVEEHNHSLRKKKKEVMQELETLQAQVEAGQTKRRELLKEQEVKREEEAELIGSRYNSVVRKFRRKKRI